MVIPTRKEVDAKKQEINNLYGRLSEIESGLKEEKKINSRLRSDLSSKTQQLLALEKTIVSEQETYLWVKTSTLASIAAIKSEGGTRIDELDSIVGELNVDMAEHDVLEEENQRLHQRLKLVAMEHYQASLVQKEERELRKQKSFDTRATMEQILRRTLKEVDMEYMLKANDKMDHEANWARIENAKLKKEAGKRQENCATLVQQQKDSYEELVLVKVHKDVLQGMAVKQEDVAALAKENLEKVRQQNADLEEQASSLQIGIEALSLQVEEKKHLQEELRKLKAVLSKAEFERKSLCKSVVKTCRKSIVRGLEIAARDNKRKGAKLTKGFQGISGDNAAAADGSNSAPVLASAPASPLNGTRYGSEEHKHAGGQADDDRTVNSQETADSLVTGSQASIGTTFLNDEAVAIQIHKDAEDAEQKALAVAESAWNSKKSDVHVATRLRVEIRKMRKRELREKLLQDAAAGYSKMHQNGKSVYSNALVSSSAYPTLDREAGNRSMSIGSIGTIGTIGSIGNESKASR
jgi:hypothetical protein